MSIPSPIRFDDLVFTNDELILRQKFGNHGIQLLQPIYYDKDTTDGHVVMAQLANIPDGPKRPLARFPARLLSKSLSNYRGLAARLQDSDCSIIHQLFRQLYNDRMSNYLLAISTEIEIGFDISSGILSDLRLMGTILKDVINPLLATLEKKVHDYETALPDQRTKEGLEELRELVQSLEGNFTNLRYAHPANSKFNGIRKLLSEVCDKWTFDDEDKQKDHYIDIGAFSLLTLTNQFVDNDVTGFRFPTTVMWGSRALVEPSGLDNFASGAISRQYGLFTTGPDYTSSFLQERLYEYSKKAGARIETLFNRCDKLFMTDLLEKPSEPTAE